MKRLLFNSIVLLATCLNVSAQSHNRQIIFTEDIDRFWTAYDSVQTTNDSMRQLHFIQTIYVDKATEGLKAFTKARNYDAALWLESIRQYPKFWKSIRPNTLKVKSMAKEIESSVVKLKALYPELREASMYFTIGCLLSGGTTTENMVLIGAEIATGNENTDVSEFTDPWLAEVFQKQSDENLVALNIHEYVHTQQKGEASNLLGKAISEGSCDFITELVLNRPLQTSYIVYGKQHEATLKQEFKIDMFSNLISRWLYNAGNVQQMADLGYFMGYQICKAYYKNAGNKKSAIKQIIELDYSDEKAVERFLIQSKYFNEPIRKEELLKVYEEQKPVLLRIEPFSNGDTTVGASVKELTLVFSKPMGKGFSIDITEKGKSAAPITGIVGFSTDGRKFTIKIDLQPARNYEFLVTNKSFRSLDGYPLNKTYLIRFRTGP